MFVPGFGFMEELRVQESGWDGGLFSSAAHIRTAAWVARLRLPGRSWEVLPFFPLWCRTREDKRRKLAEYL